MVCKNHVVRKIIIFVSLMLIVIFTGLIYFNNFHMSKRFCADLDGEHEISIYQKGKFSKWTDTYSFVVCIDGKKIASFKHRVPYDYNASYYFPKSDVKSLYNNDDNTYEIFLGPYYYEPDMIFDASFSSIIYISGYSLQILDDNITVQEKDDLDLFG